MSVNRRSESRQSTSEMGVLSPHAFGVDDDEPCLLCSKLRKIVFSVWVTLSEHKRVILHERRRAPALLNFNAITPALLRSFGLDINNAASDAKAIAWPDAPEHVFVVEVAIVGH